MGQFDGVVERFSKISDGLQPGSRLAPLAATDPRMVAWNAYMETDEYNQVVRGATRDDRGEQARMIAGVLWTVFMVGFEASEAQARRRAAEEAKCVLGLSAAASRAESKS